MSKGIWEEHLKHVGLGFKDLDPLLVAGRWGDNLSVRSGHPVWGTMAPYDDWITGGEVERMKLSL